MVSIRRADQAWLARGTAYNGLTLSQSLSDSSLALLRLRARRTRFRFGGDSRSRRLRRGVVAAVSSEVSSSSWRLLAKATCRRVRGGEAIGPP